MNTETNGSRQRWYQKLIAVFSIKPKSREELEEMLAAGYTPVGKDFPVFLHPQTHEEYALARTERKVAKGYHGFEFFADSDVTLEEDLIRRDLTINAIAEDEQGNIKG